MTFSHHPHTQANTLRLTFTSFILTLLLGGCSWFEEGLLKVRIQNDTPENLTLVEIGGVVHLDQARTLGPGKGISLTSDDQLGYTTFIVEYQGHRYAGDSGNSDDYSEYQVVFDESAGSLRCRVVYPGGDKHTAPLAPAD